MGRCQVAPALPRRYPREVAGLTERPVVARLLVFGVVTCRFETRINSPSIRHRQSAASTQQNRTCVFHPEIPLYVHLLIIRIPYKNLVEIFCRPNTPEAIRLENHTSIGKFLNNHNDKSLHNKHCVCLCARSVSINMSCVFLRLTVINIILSDVYQLCKRQKYKSCTLTE